MFLALFPFYFVSCRHNMSIFLCSIKSASSLLLPIIVTIFKILTLMSECLPFNTFCCLFTSASLSPLFFNMFKSSIISTGALLRHLRRSLVIRAATDPVWIYDHNAFVCFGKKFLRGCSSCRNPPNLSGLGTGSKKHRNVPPMSRF